MTEPKLALKFTKPGAVGSHSGFAWPQPNGRPGKWVRTTGDLVACQNGIHACTLDQAPEWLKAECYVIELGGEIENAGNKLVARRGRLVRQVETWDDKTVRLFAADCAEHVLPIFEKNHPKDQRPRETIRIARLYAKGKATRGELDAAWAAARAAAWDAARAAAWDAAWAAARTAARDAAWDAARDAAWAAERKWQTRRLARYLGKDVVASLTDFGSVG